MIKNIIEKIRKSNSLDDSELEYLNMVISNPVHEDFPELYLSGLV